MTPSAASDVRRATVWLSPSCGLISVAAHWAFHGALTDVRVNAQLAVYFQTTLSFRVQAKAAVEVAVSESVCCGLPAMTESVTGSRFWMTEPTLCWAEPGSVVNASIGSAFNPCQAAAKAATAASGAGP